MIKPLGISVTTRKIQEVSCYFIEKKLTLTYV